MNMYGKLYSRGEVRETAFAEILLFCGTWPMFLGGKNDKRIECGVKDRKSYEESDGNSLSERGVPEHMVVVEDTAGVWLLEGYDCYTHCKSLVEGGLLPPVWGVYNVRYIGRLSWEMKVGLGLHAGLKRTLARNHGVSEVRLLRAVWHLNSASRTVWTEGEQVALLKKLFEGNGMDDISTMVVVNIVETARKVGCVMGEFVEQHAEVLSEKVGSLIFAEEWCDDKFMSQYNKEWWYEETPIVQVLLLFVVLGFDGFKNVSLGKKSNLRLQFILILRRCAKVITIASKGRYEFLLKSESKRGHALPKDDTIFHMVGFAIMDILLDSVKSLEIEYDEDALVLDLEPPEALEVNAEDNTFILMGAELPEALFNETMGRCVSKVLEVLHEHGYVGTRSMTKHAELG